MRLWRIDNPDILADIKTLVNFYHVDNKKISKLTLNQKDYKKFLIGTGQRSRLRLFDKARNEIGLISVVSATNRPVTSILVEFDTDVK